MRFGKKLLGQVADLFAPNAKPDSPGFAVGIVSDNKVVFREGFGQATLEWPSPITSETVFDVGSMAKQFVGMAIALLEEEGRLSIGDKIHQHLPEFPEYARDVTLADLLYQTSGIRNYTVLGYYMMGYHESDAMTKAEVYDLLLRLRSLHFGPGERWEYSDSNYFLLAEIVERITGRSLGEYAREAIFEPLDMHDTLFRECHSQVIRNRAMSYVTHPIAFKSPYLYRHQRAVAGSYHTLISNYEHVGAEGLFTTLEDLFKWDRNYGDNRLGRGRMGLIDRVLSPGARIDEDIGYGFGLNVGRFRGKKFYGHDGAIHGYTSSMMHFPEEHATIICLANHNRIGAWECRNRIMDLIFSNGDLQASPLTPPQRTEPDLDDPAIAGSYQNPETALEKPLCADALVEYLGTYRSDELGATFIVDDGGQGLVVRNSDKHFCSMDLFYEPTTQDNFIAYDPNPTSSQITFLRENGRIEAFVFRDYDGDGREDIRFEKCPPA